MMMRRLRVLLVSPLPPPAGGIARWTQLVTAHLADRDEVVVRVVNTALRLRSPHSSSAVRRVAAGSVEAVWTIVRLLVATTSQRPDVVHINVSGQLGVLRDLVATWWCRAIGVPVVAHLRFGRVPDISDRNTVEWRMLVRVLEAASAVIAIDRATADALSSARLSTTVHVVPNCVDLGPKPTNGATRAPGPVLYIGWLVPSKGLEDLLVAWGSVRRDGLTLRLLGGYEPDYVASLESRGLLTPDVAVLGEVPHSQVVDELRACGLLVLPSHTEGFPNVVVEAMSVAAPVVATSVGAVPEMLTGGAGIVVPPHDADALAGAMLEVLDDPLGSRAMGERAREKAENEFSVASVAAQYVRLWRSLVGADRRSRD